MFYYTIQNNLVISALNENALKKYYTNIYSIDDEQYNPSKYLIDGDKLILNPHYEEEQQQKERERINNLTCTKRVFALALQEYGITYAQLKELIATNEQAQLEWDLCVELQRSNPLLDLMAMQLGITSKQLDNIFLLANNEIDTLPSEETELETEQDTESEE